MKNIFSCELYLEDLVWFESVNSIYKKYFNTTNAPSRCTIGLKNCFWKEKSDKFEFSAISISMLGFCGEESEKSFLRVQSISRWAPACIGPYSQAQIVKGICFLAGQIGLKSETMSLSNDPIQQICLSIHHLSAVCHAIGSNFVENNNNNNNNNNNKDNDNETQHEDESRVVNLRVFVTDPYLIEKVKEQLKKLNQQFDVNSTKTVFLQVNSLPRGASVEMQPITLTKQQVYFAERFGFEFEC